MIIYSYYLFHSLFDAWNNRKTLFVISTEIIKILLKFLRTSTFRLAFASLFLSSFMNSRSKNIGKFKIPSFPVSPKFRFVGNERWEPGWQTGWWRGWSCLCIRVADSTIFQEIRHRVSARLTKRDLRDPTRKFQAGDRRNHVITSLMTGINSWKENWKKDISR